MPVPRHGELKDGFFYYISHVVTVDSPVELLTQHKLYAFPSVEKNMSKVMSFMTVAVQQIFMKVRSILIYSKQNTGRGQENSRIDCLCH